jgi:hypothetical protein
LIALVAAEVERKVVVGRLDVEEVSGLHVGVAIGVRGARDAV